ncbi:MAG: TonB-dependent receptor [Bacteroidales bacterium]
MLRYILISILVLSASVKSYSQQPTQTIRGIVIDNASQSPLAFANVVILNTNPLIGTTTDFNGNFQLNNLSIGRYDIKFSMIGYETFIERELQLTSAKEVFLNISLKENATILSGIVIRPNINKEQPLNSTATLSAKMLSVEEAKRYAGGFDDPARLVSSFAGVSSSVGNNAIVVRGNSPQALQWKIEGVEIPNPNHFADMAAFGGGGLTALSSQLLANSDFLLGAFPAEYSNALSGVFDIFMRNGNNSKNEHCFQLGLTGIDAASEGAFRKGKKSSYLFNYRYSTLALLEPIMPENAGGVRYQDLSFKLNFPTKKTGIFSVWGIGLIDASGAKAKTDSSKWEYDADKEEQNVKQYMGAAGIAHKIFLNNRQYVKSTLAATISGIDFTTVRLNDKLSYIPKNEVNNQNWNFVISSFINTKFSSRHTNKSGFTATGLMYNFLLKNAILPGNPLQIIEDENGYSTLLSAYTNSSLNLNENTTMNIGINGQWFALNHNYTIEPRIGIKYQFLSRQSLSFAYGLHSRLERLNYYFTRNSLTGNGSINKNLDFTKSHHLVLGYDFSLSEYIHFKIEAYYQLLFNVPVINDSSFSLINMQNDWFFNGKLQNSGEGRNYGLDISIEKYFSQGYYFMLTSSLFNSKYKGGDNIWRNTRYNRNYAINFLIGKEWQTGKENQNTLSLNARLCYQGGEHYSAVDKAASITAKEAIFDETNAFSEQFPAAFTTHFTASYKINKKKTSHEFALKIINATMYEEFSGFQYNYLLKAIIEKREALFIPNLSYKIDF